MARSGRNLRWTRDGVQIAGARTDSLTVSAEPVDITDKDDAGWRTLLADVGVRTVSASISGVLKNGVLASEIVGSGTALLKSCVLTVDGVYTMTGSFHLSNLVITGEQADAVTFEAEMQGSGTYVQTIAPYNITPPVISGTPTVGQILSVANGTWGGDATITYMRPWQKSLDGVNWESAGSAAGTYTLLVGDVGYYFRKEETATNSVGSSVAVSNIIGPVTA